MAHRHRDQPFEQFTDEKAGLVVAAVLGILFVVGVVLVVSGLSA